MPVSYESTDGALSIGFPLGSYNAEVEKKPQLHNHVKIRIGYNNQASSTSPDEGQIVDFTVTPYSIQYTESNVLADKTHMESCDRSSDPRRPLYLSKSSKTGNVHVYWTYSVEWIEDNSREWRTRWDIYFSVGSGSDEVNQRRFFCFVLFFCRQGSERNIGTDLFLCLFFRFTGSRSSMRC